MITITVEIENTYEDGTEITTHETVEVPPIPADEDAAWDWADEHIRPLTGTGKTEGDAWYDCTITASSDPAIVGRKFNFGY